MVSALVWALALGPLAASADLAEPPAEAQRWAVIAVGSKGFFNYRHQADGCHAYGLMLKSGIPASNIVLMMQDDVAGDKENAFPGELYNRPGFDSPNVYNGCKPDYKGDIVTAKLFLSVITGDSAAVNGGKVLKSGPGDHVFLNFIDHGGPGIVAFPNGPMLHKTDLTSALKTMKENSMFKELVFYMEACESGSMFDSQIMPSGGGGMYAVTASNAKESSWGTYCDPGDTVKGKSLHTCLGDLFSVAWMEDTDKGTFASETIDEQVRLVVKRTNKSHVTQFGDTTVAAEPIGRFELNSSPSAPAEPPAASAGASAVDVRDIPLHVSYQKWQAQTEEDAKAAAWEKHLRIREAREADERMFEAIALEACGGAEACARAAGMLKRELVDEGCHKALVDAVYEDCPVRSDDASGGWNGFNMKFSQVLVNLCEMKGAHGRSPLELVGVVRAQCQGPRASATLVV